VGGKREAGGSAGGELGGNMIKVLRSQIREPRQFLRSSHLFFISGGNIYHTLHCLGYGGDGL